MIRCALLVFWIGSILVAPALAQRDPSIPHAQDRPPGPALSPEEAVRKMTVPPGFQVEVVASEPDIVNPVAMTFDERGRVWITESVEYPRQSAGPGRDRIKILEDTDGDGKADKFTIFAEGLNIPSGIAVGSGGVWVANSPDLLFLKDVDGDDKADVKEVVLTGFGRHDTHELPNSLTWGPDGSLYGWNGVFNPAKIDYRGKRYEFTCAVFRIDPRTRDFNVFCEGTSNPWGITWDKEGSAFASACVIDHLWHLTETGYYHRQGGPYPPFTWKLESIVDHKHQKAAYCGITYFDSPAYPAEYREKLFMGNIHGNGINVDRIDRQGATYRGRTDPDFLNANDAWFMPVVQKVGPDGSLYILDWYDRYHCYQDANRDPAGIDRLKGRLYRVRYGQTPRAPRFDMARETGDQLIARLASPNIYDRETAQRLLRERDDPANRLPLERLTLDESASTKTRLHALWTMIGTGRIDGVVHGKLLADKNPTIRAWAIRAAGNFARVNPEIVAKIRAMDHDPSLDVILQVVIGSRKIEGFDPLPTLLAVLGGNEAGADSIEKDSLLLPIVWQNLQPLLDKQGAEFVRIVTSRDLDRIIGLNEIIPRAIERFLGGPKPQPEVAADLVSKFLGAPIPEARIDAARWVLEILEERNLGGEISRVLKARLESLILGIVTAKPAHPLAFDAALVGSVWGDPASARRVLETFQSKRDSEENRLRAMTSLIARKDAGVLAVVGPILVDPRNGSPGFRAGLLSSLGRLDDPQVAGVLLEAYPRLEPDLKPKAIEVLTQRKGWSLALLGAIEGNVVNRSSLNVNQVRKLAATQDSSVADRVRSIWGVIREGRNPAREQVIDRIKASLQNAKSDPVAGAIVFKNVCGQCHKIYGEGQEVGPDVTLNGRGSYDQLLSNVLDPSLVIGPAYQATTIATADGRVLTGLIVEDSPERVVLRLQGGKLETVARPEVEDRKLSNLSLMPEGIEAQVTPQELANLFAFITLDRPPTDPTARPIPGTPAGLRK